MRSVEDAVSSVLAAAHPRLRERCSESNIISVLEDDCGAYDIDSACAQGRRPQPIATSCASSAGENFRACDASPSF